MRYVIEFELAPKRRLAVFVPPVNAAEYEAWVKAGQMGTHTATFDHPVTEAVAVAGIQKWAAENVDATGKTTRGVFGDSLLPADLRGRR
jgi:hypothetical protein